MPASKRDGDDRRQEVNVLRDAGWLADCTLWYWGDLDTQGFAILSQLRGYWPQTRSFLMDTFLLVKQA